MARTSTTSIVVSLLLLLSLSFSNLYADVLFNATFDGGTLPAGWSTSAIQGTDVWTVRNAPAFGSPSGSYYAVFDDQSLGAGVSPNEAAMYTPVMDLSGRTNITLRMSHHWYGVENTFAYVEYSTDGGTTWTTHITYEKITKGSLATPQDTVMDLTTELAGEANAQIRFRYDDGFQAGRYWYIDDIALYANPDVRVVGFLLPDHIDCNTTYTASETVEVQVVNFSYEPVSNVPVQCDITNGLTQTLTSTIPGPIAPGDTVTLSFPDPIDMSANARYDFEVYTTLGTDAYMANNTLYAGRQNLVTTYPYFADFNLNAMGWYAGQADPTNEARY